MSNNYKLNEEIAKLINSIYYCKFDSSFAEQVINNLINSNYIGKIDDRSEIFDLLTVPYLIFSSIESYRERRDTENTDDQNARIISQIESVSGKFYVVLREKFVGNLK